jgi:pyruvate formate lyase activating enzyme
VSVVATRYWHRREDGRIQCDLCPRACKLREGQRGLCFVRECRDGIVLTTYGRSSGLCVDPIEKKPLFHYLPGSSVLSFGTAGCNLACRFCQNWTISKARETDILADEAEPEAIARAAQRLGCRSVAFTYNEPVIYLEYAVDVAVACHQLGIKTVAVTAGYVNPEPRTEFFSHMDAANIDLKAFDDGFYRRYCAGRLQPVLDTLDYVATKTDTWLEVTTLLIPGLNDSEEEIAALSEWVAGHLGRQTPLHFTAFYPAFRMIDRPPTTPGTLTKARQIARSAGLQHVYTGNINDVAGQTTRCSECGTDLITRDGYRLLSWRLDESGRCSACGTICAGVFETSPGSWGPRRRPIHLTP